MLIAIIVIIVLLVLWLISAQRKLVNADELSKNSLSQIGVQQNSRWDALTAIAEQIKSYDEHEYNTIKDVIAQRSPIGRDSSVQDAQAQEAQIESALKMINVVVEKYPELKANELYVKSLDDINRYENQVRVSRMTFNDTVTKYNKLIRMFPDSIAAAIFHFSTRDYLAEPQGKTEMPSMR
ncbi:MAG: LemA family protein [Bacteroidales bacterium]|nr:LemA family protein [Bacteroidales bacterium]